MDTGAPPGTALMEELDYKQLIILRDGRKLIGILRSFDQFANLVLEGAYERIIIGDCYGDIELGLFVIRGENVVLLGRLDETQETPSNLRRVSPAEIKQLQKDEKVLDSVKGSMLSRMDFLDLE